MPYLNQLQSSLHIKIPNGVKSLSLLTALEYILYGDGFIETDDDSGCVEQEEHEDGGNENHRKVDIVLLAGQSFLDGFST